MPIKEFFSEPPAAVILAAGRTPAWLSSLLEPTCPAMIPVNGRPVIHWVLRYLQSCGIKQVNIGARPEEVKFRQFLMHVFDQSLQLTITPIVEDRGPGYTLLQCMRQLPPKKPCLVILGDTIFEFPDDVKDLALTSFVLTARVNDSRRWCLASVGKDGNVQELIDKPEDNPNHFDALIGVYYFDDTGPAIAALESEEKRTNMSMQLRHALLPYLTGGNSLHAYHAKQWLDCGNIDLLTSSRRRLLQARSFNTLSIDELRGTITKRSTHTEKFINEINYYRLLPPELSIFFPRLVEFDTSSTDSSLTLEYYGYPSISEKWVFEELDVAIWRSIFDILSRIMACFSRYPVQIEPSVLKQFYLGRTFDRIDMFSHQDMQAGRLVAAETININGVNYNGWPELRPLIETELGTLLQSARGQIIHGDLCFPNILFDPLSKLVKLIDPRGSFGEAGVYGDVQYDAAKLLHSIDGGYDFIIHDMFDLLEGESEYQLKLFLPRNAAEVLDVFYKTIGQQFNIKAIRLIEGLIFLSICALHADKPQRQKAMWLTGIKICNEVLET